MNPPQPRETRWPPEPEEVPGSWLKSSASMANPARRAHRKSATASTCPTLVTRHRAIAAARSRPAASSPALPPPARTGTRGRRPTSGDHRREAQQHIPATATWVPTTSAASPGTSRPPETVPVGDVKLLLAAPVDTTIDCVAALPDDEAVAFLDGALRTWDIGRDLHQWAHQSRKHGCRRMRDLLPRTDARAESRPESILRYRLNSAGYHGWVPQFPVTAGNVGHFIDLADPYHRIALEFHGAGHWDDPANGKPTPNAPTGCAKPTGTPSKSPPPTCGATSPHLRSIDKRAEPSRKRLRPASSSSPGGDEADRLGAAVWRIGGSKRAGGVPSAGQGHRMGRGSNRTDWAGKPGER